MSQKSRGRDFRLLWDEREKKKSEIWAGEDEVLIIQKAGTYSGLMSIAHSNDRECVDPMMLFISFCLETLGVSERGWEGLPGHDGEYRAFSPSHILSDAVYKRQQQADIGLR